jgi:hypothetical protein
VPPGARPPGLPAKSQSFATHGGEQSVPLLPRIDAHRHARKLDRGDVALTVTIID